MSTLPRNVRARKAKIQKKYGAVKESNKKLAELDTICDKHKIGALSLSSCKYANEEGKVTFIEQDQIRGNMRYGLMLVKATTMGTVGDAVYDVVEVIKIKREKDEKKKEDEDNKARAEFERLQKDNVNISDILPEGGEKHQEMVKKLTEQAEVNKEVEKLMDNINADASEPTTGEIIPEEGTINTETEPLVETKKSKKKLAREKKEQAIEQMKRQLAEKANQDQGNRHYRNFMKDLRARFNLQPMADVRYFEVKMEATAMIIENATVYKLTMPASTSETYLLVLGDLQMKSQLLRRIDPAYGSDKILQDRSDFLERIKTQENVKITEHQEDLLEEEFDDLDALGLSSEENSDKVTTDKVVATQVDKVETKEEKASELV